VTDAETAAAANALAVVIEGLRDDVKGATAAFERSSRRTRLFVIGLAVLFVIVAWVAFSNRSTAQNVAKQTVIAKAQAACVRDYSNQNADRTNKLLPLSNARGDALDALIRTLPTAATQSPAQQKAKFTAALFAYLKASDAYSAAVQSNPPPLAPRFTC
jgi:hypothetical protein